MPQHGHTHMDSIGGRAADEQRILENLDAWARRGDAYVRAIAAQKARELTVRRIPNRGRP